MTDWLIENVRVLRPREGVVGRSVWVRGERLAAVDPAEDELPPTLTRIDGEGRLLTPGMIDLHIHGVGLHLFEGDPDQLLAAAAMLPRFGVTSVLPTVYHALDRDSLPKLRALAQATGRWAEQSGARIPGLHLEGPFLALAGAGGLTMTGDVAWLDTLLDATDGRVTAMSVSPDTGNVLPVIERLVAAKVKVLLTHTRANVEQTEAAIDAGASHATHFYDVFHLPGKADAGVRPVGAVEAILADERVSVDFIADGVHVHPTAIRAALRAKGPEKVLLITDANIGAGLPAGVYRSLNGTEIRAAADTGARVHAPGTEKHNRLFGSALTMDVGITNLMRWLDTPAHEVWAMGTHNVAERMGLPEVGDLCVGHAADLVLWDELNDGSLRAVRTWVAGRSVFDIHDDANQPPAASAQPISDAPRD